MVKQKPIREKQKSSYFENLLFDSANTFRNALQPLNEANKYKGMVQKIAPQLLESRQRFNLRKEPRLGLPIIPIDDAPGGMVPIGNSGWYVTPEEPASPTDCARYPDSPFCGGIPLSFKPIDIGLNIVIDQCNLGIRLNPVIAFIKLPPIAIAYRKPECRIPPPPAKTEHSLLQYCFNIDCKNATLYIKYKGTCYNYRYSRHENIPNKGAYRIDPNYPLLRDEENVIATDGVLEIRNFGKGSLCVNLIPSSLYSDYIYITDGLTPRATRRGVTTARTITQSVGHDLSEYAYREMHAVLFSYRPILTAPNVTYYADQIAYLDAELESNIFFDNFEITSIYCDKPIPPPPLPPEEKPKKDKMDCCNLVAALVVKVDKLTKTIGEYEDEAKSLVKTVKKLSDIVGVDEYPAKLPASLISKDEGWLGNLIPNADIEIKNLTSLIGWYIERFDEIMGQFEIPIEIVDSDPTQPGNQPKGIKLPNIAESIAEIVTLLLQCSINSETLISTTTRALIETGQDKQQNFSTYMLLMALADYVGFDYKEKKVTLPMMFTPGKESLDELLQETDITVNVAEYNEKFNLQADLIRFRKAASILDSVFFKKVNPSADIKKQIMDDVKATRDLMKKINKTEENDFDKFIDDASKLYNPPPNTP